MLVAIAILVLAVYTYLGFKMPAIALVTSPVVALTMVVIGEAESSGTVVIAPFIFFATVIVAIRLLSSQSDPVVRNPLLPVQNLTGRQK